MTSVTMQIPGNIGGPSEGSEAVPPVESAEQFGNESEQANDDGLGTDIKYRLPVVLLFDVSESVSSAALDKLNTGLQQLSAPKSASVAAALEIAVMTCGDKIAMPSGFTKFTAFAPPTLTQESGRREIVTFAKAIEKALYELQETQKQWHPGVVVMRPILIVVTGGSWKGADLTNRDIAARFNFMASLGRVEMAMYVDIVAIVVDGKDGEAFVNFGAPRMMPLADPTQIGSMVAQIWDTSAFSEEAPSKEHAPAMSDDGSRLPTPAWEPPVQQFAPAAPPQTIDVRVREFHVTFPVGTDVDYVAQLVHRLSSSPPVLARESHDAPSAPEALLPDMSWGLRHAYENLHHAYDAVSRFFSTLGQKPPSVDQVATLIRSDLATHMVLRDIADTIARALQEPRVPPEEARERISIAEYWQMLDDRPERRARLEALNEVLRDALAKVKTELLSAKAVR